MRRTTALLVLAMSAPACAPAPRAAPSARAVAPVVAAPSSAPAARVKRCSAQPATLYGDEPVVFEIEGQGPPGALVEVEVLDQRRQSVLRRVTPVPGRVLVADLPSGDFSLRIVGSSASCVATVNRELSRGSSGTR